MATLRIGGANALRSIKVVQSTDVDALASKYSALQKHYFEDEFLETFVDSVKAESARVASQFNSKLPLINRGTFLRRYGVHKLVSAFVAGGGSQIVSLGAGSDTLPFYLLQDNDVIIHELDYQSSVDRKAKTILGDSKMRSIINASDTSTSSTGSGIHTSNYHLHPIDLASIYDSTPKLQGLDSSRNTLILSECCLCYLLPEKSTQVIKWLRESLDLQVSVALYEPLGGDDKFGQVMVENLASRGISIPSVQRYHDLPSQLVRLTQDWDLSSAGAVDIQFVHDSWLEAHERDRIDHLEFLDEREELTLLLQHYCIVWGSTGSVLQDLPTQVS